MTRIPIALVVELDEAKSEFTGRTVYFARLVISWDPQDHDGVMTATSFVSKSTAPYERPDDAIRQALVALNPQKLVST